MPMAETVVLSPHGCHGSAITRLILRLPPWEASKATFPGLTGCLPSTAEDSGAQLHTKPTRLLS